MRERIRHQQKSAGLPDTLWQIHVDIWQNQYNIVKLKNKIKYFKKKCFFRLKDNYTKWKLGSIEGLKISDKWK